MELLPCDLTKIPWVVRETLPHSYNTSHDGREFPHPPLVHAYVNSMHQMSGIEGLEKLEEVKTDVLIGECWVERLEISVIDIP